MYKVNLFFFSGLDDDMKWSARKLSKKQPNKQTNKLPQKAQNPNNKHLPHQPHTQTLGK